MTRDAMATDKIAAPVGPFSVGVRGAALPLGAAVEMDAVVG
jgi:hypothetical protein